MIYNLNEINEIKIEQMLIKKLRKLKKFLYIYDVIFYLFNKKQTLKELIQNNDKIIR